MSDTPYHMPPPIEETSISDRTDEQLVRTIAEWMGLELRHDVPGAPLPLAYLREPQHTSRGPIQKLRYFDPTSEAADRERVMLAMPEVSFRFYQHKDSVSVWLERGGIWESVTQNATLGRAFCEAVVAWIEQQEEAGGT